MNYIILVFWYDIIWIWRLIPKLDRNYYNYGSLKLLMIHLSTWKLFFYWHVKLILKCINYSTYHGRNSFIIKKIYCPLYSLIKMILFILVQALKIVNTTKQGCTKLFFFFYVNDSVVWLEEVPNFLLNKNKYRHKFF